MHIPQGSIKGIVTHLSQKGYDVLSMDRWLIHWIGRPQSGWINTEGIRTKGDLLYAITTAKAPVKSITLFPGETTLLTLKSIAEVFHLSFPQLQQIYNAHSPYQEGYLVPQTYAFPYNADAVSIVTYLLSYAKKHKAQYKEAYNISGTSYSWLQIVTIASIIEKEAANKSEMRVISSVIYNRLKRRMRLQMDGTLNYGTYSHQPVTAKRIKEDNSQFNTYKRAGLPPIPVSIVSTHALDAAINPLKTDYLYFVKGENGSHLFSKSYRAHLKKINNVKKRNK